MLNILGKTLQCNRSLMLAVLKIGTAYMAQVIFLMLFWVWTKVYLYFQNDLCINSIIFHIVCIHSHERHFSLSHIPWWPDSRDENIACAWSTLQCIVWDACRASWPLGAGEELRIGLTPLFPREKQKPQRVFYLFKGRLGVTLSCSKMNWSWWLTCILYLYKVHLKFVSLFLYL